MMQLFDKSAQMCSQIITKNYSTSFTLGIKTLHNRFRTPIYSIYGFVRLADEIVDTFFGYNQESLFDRFEADTYKAIDEKISLNPVLHAFQLVVNEYNIDKKYIESFLKSMKMDLEVATYDNSKYKEYIYGSAESVGLMCLKVFCEGDQKLFDSLEYSAKCLGSAFQKVNFLRDIKSDYQDRGRVYFPDINFQNFTASEKQKIEQDIENDFNEAYKGILGLPKEAKLGVLLAYKYYVKLFENIKKVNVKAIQNERIRVSNFKKIELLTYNYILCRLAII
jgi:15-cis-phytoene synthase